MPISGLDTAQEYDFRIAMETSEGQGEWSNARSATPNILLTAPQDIEVVERNGEILVKVKDYDADDADDADTSGYPDRYEFQYRPCIYMDGDPNPCTETAPWGLHGNYLTNRNRKVYHYTFKGLENGVKHEFRVRARRGTHKTAYSATFSGTPDSGIPLSSDRVPTDMHIWFSDPRNIRVNDLGWDFGVHAKGEVGQCEIPTQSGWCHIIRVNNHSNGLAAKREYRLPIMRGSARIADVTIKGFTQTGHNADGEAVDEFVTASTTFTYFPQQNLSTPRYETLEIGHYEHESVDGALRLNPMPGAPEGVKLGCRPSTNCLVAETTLRMYIVERDNTPAMKYVISNSSFDPPANVDPSSLSGPWQDGDVAKIRFDMRNLKFSYDDWHFRRNIDCRMSHITIKSERNLDNYDGHAQARILNWGAPIVSTPQGNINTWTKGRNPGTIEEHGSYRRFIGHWGDVQIDLYNAGNAETEWNRLELTDASTKGRTGRIDNYKIRGTAICDNGVSRHTEWKSLGGLTLR